MSYKKVLCYGTINPDLMYFIDEFLKSEETSEVKITKLEQEEQRLIVLKI